MSFFYLQIMVVGEPRSATSTGPQAPKTSKTRISTEHLPRVYRQTQEVSRRMPKSITDTPNVQELLADEDSVIQDLSFEEPIVRFLACRRIVD